MQITIYDIIYFVLLGLYVIMYINFKFTIFILSITDKKDTNFLNENDDMNIDGENT